MSAAVLLFVVHSITCASGAPTPAQGVLRRDASFLQTPATPSLERFSRALETYLALRSRVTTEVPSLTVTVNPADIENTSNRLAAAITRGRGAAAAGEFFGPPVDAELRRRLKDLASKMDLRAIVMPEDAEERSGGKVTVHARYPEGTPVSTMPPSVLAALPAIPATLEYRFVGRTLILRDVEAALILDFLPNAVP